MHCILLCFRVNRKQYDSSSVFNTINNDITGLIAGTSQLQNNLGIFGVSLEDIWYAFQSYGVDGLKNVFSDVITSMDIDMLDNYNALLDEGATMRITLFLI